MLHIYTIFKQKSFARDVFDIQLPVIMMHRCSVQESGGHWTAEGIPVFYCSAEHISQNSLYAVFGQDFFFLKGVLN